MTRKVGNVVIIEEEPDGICSVCGKVDETRPYGPDFKPICYDCGMADEAMTDARLRHVLFGDPMPS